MFRPGQRVVAYGKEYWLEKRDAGGWYAVDSDGYLTWLHERHIGGPYAGHVATPVGTFPFLSPGKGRV
jgi:hypothetical protein